MYNVTCWYCRLVDNTPSPLSSGRANRYHASIMSCQRHPFSMTFCSKLQRRSTRQLVRCPSRSCCARTCLAGHVWVCGGDVQRGPCSRALSGSQNEDEREEQRVPCVRANGPRCSQNEVLRAPTKGECCGWRANSIKVGDLGDSVGFAQPGKWYCGG